MRILVVEDEVKLNNAIKRALELQNYAVDSCFDGESGLDMALGEEFDLLILDVMMPKIDGFELCRSVRKEGVKTPILMLTAKDAVSDKINGLDSGADDYLAKPFSFEELFARVRALIRRVDKNYDENLRAGDLTLNPVTFLVKRGEKRIDLSSKEFAILEYLLRNKNSILTKQQIVDHVWDYDADVLLSTVEVHIKNLRDKIDKGYPKKLINTFRGFGYQIGDSSV